MQIIAATIESHQQLNPSHDRYSPWQDLRPKQHRRRPRTRFVGTWSRASSPSECRRDASPPPSPAWCASSWARHTDHHRSLLPLSLRTCPSGARIQPRAVVHRQTPPRGGCIALPAPPRRGVLVTVVVLLLASLLLLLVLLSAVSVVRHCERKQTTDNSRRDTPNEIQLPGAEAIGARIEQSQVEETRETTPL